MLKTVINTDSLPVKIEGFNFDINTGINRRRIFGEFVRKIEDDELLNLVIRYFRTFKLLKTEPQLLNLYHSSNIPEHKKTLVKAYLYGTAFEFESHITYHFPILHLNALPTLKFEITQQYIKHNLFEIIQRIERIKLSKQSDFVESTYSLENQKKYYSSLIKFYSDYDYIEQTEYFKKEVEFLKNRKEGLFLPELTKTPDSNPFPRLFKNASAFNLFVAYKENIEDNEHTEYSYIFRKMKTDNLIYPDITDFAYREWLSNEYGVIISQTKQLSKMGVKDKNILYKVLKDQVLK